MSNFIIRDEKTLKEKAELVTELIGIQQAVKGVQTRSSSNKYKEERDEITRFFEHDEREEMRTKEEIIGNNKMDSLEDLLS